MNPDEQISAEEEIAAYLYNFDDRLYMYFGEEEVATMGRHILKQILTRFRPDLFNDDGTYIDDQPSRCESCGGPNH